MKASRMTQRVEHEVQIHYQLKHPSILELYTFFEDKNYVYLVLELCHNGEMQRYLKARQKCLDEDEARHYLKQVVDGMIYLHSHSILHRDLTLSNLLLTKDMNVKIADFGLATQLNIPDEKHFTMCGTPNFISPEIASRNAHGLEADVWSLGCMMYTFLTGKPPFDTDGIRNTLNKVVLAEFEMPKYLSPEAQDLITCLLKKNPMDRIALSKVLEHPFMTKQLRQQQQQKLAGSSLPSSSSSSFKPINSFNESIDSGRGTMTVTNTSSSSSQQQQPRSTSSSNPALRNLPTLQSGQEQDFHLHNNNNKNNLTSSSSSSLSPHNNHLSAGVARKAHIPEDMADSSKNLYYNRFLKQQQHQLQQQHVNTPPSPPVKLSSSGNYQQPPLSNHLAYNQLSRSNSNLNMPNQYQQPNYSSQPYYNEFNGLFWLLVELKLYSSWFIVWIIGEVNQQVGDKVNSRSEPPAGHVMHRSDSVASLSNPKSLKKPKKSKKPDADPDAETKCIHDAVSPFRTGPTLLRPTRQASKNAVVSPCSSERFKLVESILQFWFKQLNIMERNEVVLELIKVKKNQQFIMEVIRIDSENDKITIYQPNNGKGCLISNRPPMPPADKEQFLQFDYKSLPQNYWKKYDLASK